MICLSEIALEAKGYERLNSCQGTAMDDKEAVRPSTEKRNHELKVEGRWQVKYQIQYKLEA